MNGQTSLEIAGRYLAALAAADTAAMQALRSPDYVLDLVFRDAYGAAQGRADAGHYHQSLFEAFGEFDIETTRTIASDTVVVAEWTFTGANTGALRPPLFVLPSPAPASGRTVKFRGTTIYVVSRGLISRETVYFDYVTLIVELGVSP